MWGSGGSRPNPIIYFIRFFHFILVCFLSVLFVYFALFDLNLRKHAATEVESERNRATPGGGLLRFCALVEGCHGTLVTSPVTLVLMTNM